MFVFLLLFFLLYFCIIISYIALFTFLTIDDPQEALAADIGIAINAILVTDNMIELDVVATETIASNDFNFVVNISIIFLLGVMVSIFEVSNHFSNFNN